MSTRYVEVRLLRHIQAAIEREEKLRDNYRIMTGQDIDLPALRRRMVRGTRPTVTMLDQVSPMWAVVRSR